MQFRGNSQGDQVLASLRRLILRWEQRLDKYSGTVEFAKAGERNLLQS